MSFQRFIAIAVIVTYSLLVLNGCVFNKVTKYRTENKPVEVTKYRTESKPVEKEVDVPYQVTEKVPKYRKVAKSKVNPTSNLRTIAFLPFTNASTDPANAMYIYKEVKNVITSDKERNNKYEIIDESRLKRYAEKNDLTKLTAADVKKINDSINLDLFVAGHVKSKQGDKYSYKIEVLNAKSMALKVARNFMGELSSTLKKVKELFYGRVVRVGTEMKQITKYHKEKKIEYEEVEVPYKTIEYRNVEVPYEEEVLDISASLGKILGYALVGYLIVAALQANAE